MPFRKPPRVRGATLRRVLNVVILLTVGAVAASALSPARIPDWAREFASDHQISLYGRSAILLDERTGTVLYEKNADQNIPPASLTKVMTIDVVFSLEAAGKISFQDRFTPPPVSWAQNMPPHSSLMFLGPGQLVSVWELLRGLAVASGNDAALALALHCAGSVEGFASLMNGEAARLGLDQLYFEEPSGLSAKNTITARQFAQFLRYYVHRWPETLEDLHSVREITYPKKENYPNRMLGRSITQDNRNTLLWSYPGVDGIKTGFIEESDYNFAVTALQDGMRLVAVVLGIPGNGHLQGSARRAADGKALLDYGFQNFQTLHADVPQTEPVTVWKGSARSVQVQPPDGGKSVPIVIPRAWDGTLSAELVQARSVAAPVEPGQRMGTIIYRAGEKVVREVPLVASTPVSQGGLVRRVWDAVRVFFIRIVQGNGFLDWQHVASLRITPSP